MMLISHKYKFIFIKTRKTGGSSVEKFLLNYLEGTDYIFGSMLPEGMPPHNVDIDVEHEGWQWISKNYPNEWNTYFKFAVDRNPWDRFVSAYHWYKERKPKKTKGGFETFLSKRYNSYIDWPLYANNKNEIMVDSLVKFEEMHEHFYELPIPYNGEMLTTFLKKTQRPRDYRSYYTEETKKLIEIGSANVIKQLNYQF